jgi:hypothetical protein
MPRNVILVSGKKLMWDGVDYPNEEKTLEAMTRYKTDGFDVEKFDEDGKACLYTRRVVTQAIAPKA